ncbi:MAG: peptide ABC transporter substrate-binding protein [Desulfitobacteriaceae bacterium]
MKKSLVTKLTGSLLAVALLVSGCGSAAPTGAKSNDSKKPQVITANLMVEVPTLDPAKTTDTTSQWVEQHLFEGLTYIGKENKPVPGMAATWDVSTDGKEYTFHLRDGVKWTNGDPVTAQDFEYSWKRVLDPKTAAQFADFMYVIKGSQEYNSGKGKAEDVGVKAVDDKTLKVTLNAPTPYLPSLVSMFTFYPVNKKAVEKDPLKWYSDPSTYISNGPFILKTWQHNQKIELVKNPHYYGANETKLDGINFVMVNDYNTAYQMFQSGDLSVVAPPVDMLKKVIAEKTATVAPYLGTYMFEFNTKKPPFNNAKIRKAFGMTIDRNQIIQYVLQGGQKAAFGYVPYGEPSINGDFRQEGGDLFKEDAVQAKQLLTEGMKEAGYTTLPPITFSFNTNDTNQKIAQAVQQMWKNNLGVDVKLQNEEWKVYLDDMKKGNYQFGRMGWIGAYLDPMAFMDRYESTSAKNYTFWNNPEYDKLVEKAKFSGDQKERMQAMHDAEKILMAEMPMSPVYFYNQIYLIKPNVKGVVIPSTMNPVFRWAYVE